MKIALSPLILVKISEILIFNPKLISMGQKISHDTIPLIKYVVTQSTDNPSTCLFCVR